LYSLFVGKFLITPYLFVLLLEKPAKKKNGVNLNAFGAERLAADAKVFTK